MSPGTQAELYQARLESILDNIVDGLITIDERGTVQSFNKACERMFGYTAGEVIGQNIKMLMPTPYAENHDQYLKNYRDTGQKKIIGIGRDVEARRKDGSVFPIDLSVAEVWVGQQRLFSGIIRDMTERKMQDDQLRHAQKMEAVGQLTSGIAHDFNNLLTVVLGNTRLIRKFMKMAKEALPVFSNIAKRVDDIDAAAQRGADLVRRLMIFTRQRPLQKTVVHINTCIQDIYGLLARALGETVEVKTVLRENVYPVHLDQDQFVNALINIAVNARDAMPRGGTLTIETSNIFLDEKNTPNPELPPGPYVCISITDTGMGMPESVRTRIFEPFFTTKPPGEGTGLGLSMIYGLIQQSGGHIHVDSEIGRGTTFKIYLPALTGKDKDAA
jgi:PAS domain S-box-containing protein